MSHMPVTVSRWGTLVRERYPLAIHLGMAAAFTVGNVGAASLVGGDRPPWPRVLVSTALVAAFFLRLRIFDEIKDYDTDVAAHPDRPLPRGLISVEEARGGAWAIAFAELILSAAMGWAALSAWTVAFLYSLAMYREFGVGTWLRPRMELYAIVHTVVASLLGVTVTASVVGKPFWSLPPTAWILAPFNWALFNVFEFSRKTFAPSEERPRADSYSKRWGPRGAVALTLAWATVAVACLGGAGAGKDPGLAGMGAALLGWAAALALAVPYLARPAPRYARRFRVSMSTWATLLYVLVGVTGLGA